MTSSTAAATVSILDDIRAMLQPEGVGERPRSAKKTSIVATVVDEEPVSQAPDLLRLGWLAEPKSIHSPRRAKEYEAGSSVPFGSRCERFPFADGCRTDNPMLGSTNELSHKDYCDPLYNRPIAGQRSCTGRPATLDAGHYQVPQHHAYFDVSLQAPKTNLECPFGGPNMGVWGVTKRFELTTYWGERQKVVREKAMRPFEKKVPIGVKSSQLNLVDLTTARLKSSTVRFQQGVETECTEGERNPRLEPGMYETAANHQFFDPNTGVKKLSKPAAFIVKSEKEISFEPAFAWTKSGFKYKMNHEGSLGDPEQLMGQDTIRDKAFWHGSNLATASFKTTSARFDGTDKVAPRGRTAQKAVSVSRGRALQYDAQRKRKIRARPSTSLGGPRTRLSAPPKSLSVREYRQFLAKHRAAFDGLASSQDSPEGTPAALRPRSACGACQSPRSTASSHASGHPIEPPTNVLERTLEAMGRIPYGKAPVPMNDVVSALSVADSAGLIQPPGCQQDSQQLQDKAELLPKPSHKHCRPGTRRGDSFSELRVKIQRDLLVSPALIGPYDDVDLEPRGPGLRTSELTFDDCLTQMRLFGDEEPSLSCK